MRTYDSPWFTAEDWGPFGISGAAGGDDWQEELFSRVAAGLSADERAFLQEIAAHPAHREIETLARAAEADVAAARWVTPFPDTVSIIALPIMHILSMRNAMSAHVGKAALEFAQGRRQQAETTIREVISAGFLMADESPTLIANMLGIAATEIGGDALEAFYAASGRMRDLEALQFARDLAERTAEVAELSGFGLSVHGSLLQIQAIVQDTLALRGLRWELLASINSYAPCLNLNKIVFGAGRRYDEWLDAVRRSLVRWPGEEE